MRNQDKEDKAINIGDRIKKIRKDNGMTMELFAKRIGLSRPAIGLLENGINNPSNQTILSICREFGINEVWLRTGEGDMKGTSSQEEDIADIANRLLAEQPKSFRLKLVKFMAKMSDEQLEMLLDMVQKLANEAEE